MQQLPQERLNIAVQGVAAAERGLQETLAYVKERKAFGKRVIDFQNTQFKLAEVKTKLTVAQVFVDHCIGLHLKGQLDAATASMAKYWVTDIQGETIDEMLQLHGGYGYMNEYPDRPAVQGRPRPAHLRRHQRDHEAADRPDAVVLVSRKKNGAGVGRRSIRPSSRSSSTRRKWSMTGCAS